MEYISETITTFITMKRFFVHVMDWLQSRVAAVVRIMGEWAKGKHTALNPHAPTSNHGAGLLLRAEGYITEHYHVRYNRLSREHELCERKGSTAAWQVLDEGLCCTLLMEMQHAGIGLSKPYLVRTVVRGYKQVPHYHPVCSYLDALPRGKHQSLYAEIH